VRAKIHSAISSVNHKTDHAGNGWQVRLTMHAFASLPQFGVAAERFRIKAGDCGSRAAESPKDDHTGAPLIEEL
jgi:hypothetical protein